jgi:hypothetical protein
MKQAGTEQNTQMCPIGCRKIEVFCQTGSRIRVIFNVPGQIFIEYLFARLFRIQAGYAHTFSPRAPRAGDGIGLTPG